MHYDSQYQLLACWCAGKRVRRRLALIAQDVGESAFADFNDRTGVMGEQSAQHGVGVLGVAQVPGAIELVQAREGKAGGVADVVQPRGGFQEARVRAENGCQAACLCGDALDARLPVGEGSWRSAWAEMFGPMKPACSCGQG
jgi:hypothetical protein